MPSDTLMTTHAAALHPSAAWLPLTNKTANAADTRIASGTASLINTSLRATKA